LSGFDSRRCHHTPSTVATRDRIRRAAMNNNHGSVPLPNGLTPEKANDLLVRNRCCYYAAQVARDHGLGTEKMLRAAFAAFRHFDRFGFEDAAIKIAEEFGLTAETILSMYASFSEDATVVRDAMTLPSFATSKEGSSGTN
jgi:hypothetical protein